MQIKLSRHGDMFTTLWCGVRYGFSVSIRASDTRCGFYLSICVPIGLVERLTSYDDVARYCGRFCTLDMLYLPKAGFQWVIAYCQWAQLLPTEFYEYARPMRNTTSITQAYGLWVQLTLAGRMSHSEMLCELDRACRYLVEASYD